jgi:hypothetical protein
MGIQRIWLVRAVLWSLLLAGTGADATVMCVASANLTVPATSEGLYVNLVTGVSGQTEASVPGFDIDIYAAVSTNPTGQMRFYWGPAATGGAGVVSSGDSYLVLGQGAVIGPASSFSRAAFTGDTSAWQSGTTAFLGMRFLNESGASTTYGWIELSTTAPLGFPATILSWCYEDSGAAITTPGGLPDLVFGDGFEQVPMPLGARSYRPELLCGDPVDQQGEWPLSLVADEQADLPHARWVQRGTVELIAAITRLQRFKRDAHLDPMICFGGKGGAIGHRRAAEARIGGQSQLVAAAIAFDPQAECLDIAQIKTLIVRTHRRETAIVRQ